VPEVADRVLLINNGRLIFEGTPDEIKSESSLDTWFNKQTLAA
jgi:ABC-type multidrug transport system ATPase subunit